MKCVSNLLVYESNDEKAKCGLINVLVKAIEQQYPLGQSFFVYVCDFCFFFCLEIVEHFVYKRKTARKFRLS